MTRSLGSGEDGAAPYPAAEQMALLRRFEPVIRYVRGELFFPMSVDDYIAESRLVAGTGDDLEVLAERGSLTRDLLAQLGRSHASRNLSLEHVDAPLDRAAYRRWRRRPDREKFKPSSRFAAVGLLSRLIDIVVRLTLILRGSVPGGFVAAAQQACARGPHHDEAHYYGHVSTDGGYTILQYWYFYAMNDFRTTFGGVNDHEGDWEQVTIYLVPDEPPGMDAVADPAAVAGHVAARSLRPAWVAYSSHDEVGADLRRRWDDPDLTRVGDHPVVFAGGGSHAGAYLQGEYLISHALPLPGWLVRILLIFFSDDGRGLLNIPYIDYKRGDGMTIGEGGDCPWTPELIDEATPWVTDYAGLWGLDTADPFGGERAPAGPRFNRNRSVRESWSQPLAWADLDLVAPTADEAHARIVDIRDRLVAQVAESEHALVERRDVLRGAHAAEQALGVPSTQPREHVRDIAAEVALLRQQLAEAKALLEGTELALTAPLAPEPPHAHLRHRSLPMGREQLAQSRLLRVWTAGSASLVLLVLGVLMLKGLASASAILWLAVAMIVIESVLRRRVVPLLIGAVILVVAIFGLWGIVSLVLGHLEQGFGALLVIGAIYMAFSTLREATR